MRISLLGLVRVGYVLGAALLMTTVLPRLGVPGRLVPDLVLIGVVSSAVLRGPVHGALLGLAAGWVLEIVPPVGAPLGLAALTLMLAGAAAGSLRRTSSRSFVRPLAALALAAVVVLGGRAGSAVVAEGSVDLAGILATLTATLAAGLLLLPVLVAVDRALVRRRLG
ncbi:rod shape-determining protein MreD [Intrasporangium calvum]|uniref:Rod shape-determining protein MreD n=1 Tax=Intrasporangium calvum TaxID=53358 RepID=A0ABT5GC31_9MICO|nr:rod shape-determining protein MreD [Intrasporangium calvum]MDC5695834.1 rod shape-determining protein MreD [Intrasporangium calvum]